MLLRRITKHVRDQNWFAVGLDFLIVVIGVFMGLQAQAWNETRADRVKERDYLGRLASDFAVIDRGLRQCMDVYADSLEAVTTVSAIIRSEAPPPDSEAFASALVRSTAAASPAGRSATFVEMMSAGELGLLRDDALRNALIAYDQRAQVNREIWRSTQAGPGAPYQRPLYENVDLRVNIGEDQFASITGFDFEGIRSDPDFLSMLRIFAGFKGNIYELCERQRDLAGSVGALIEEE